MAGPPFQPCSQNLGPGLISPLDHPAARAISSVRKTVVELVVDFSKFQYLDSDPMGRNTKGEGELTREWESLEISKVTKNDKEEEKLEIQETGGGEE